MPGLTATRAPLMMEVVVAAMAVVVPALWWSVLAVRRRRYEVHRRTQTTLGLALLGVVALFELEVRLHGWRQHAAASPHYADGTVTLSLVVHLAFAVSAALLWLVVLPLAWRRFGRPARPNAHSRLHRRLGWAAVACMTGTAVTGWLFFWLAFVA